MNSNIIVLSLQGSIITPDLFSLDSTITNIWNKNVLSIIFFQSICSFSLYLECLNTSINIWFSLINVGGSFQILESQPFIFFFTWTFYTFTQTFLSNCGKKWQYVGFEHLAGNLAVVLEFPMMWKLVEVKKSMPLSTWKAILVGGAALDSLTTFLSGHTESSAAGGVPIRALRK